MMGANSYIGNAPNFMVKSIAEESGIAMPHFFGYMGYSALVLLPVFALVTLRLLHLTLRAMATSPRDPGPPGLLPRRARGEYDLSSASSPGSRRALARRPAAPHRAAKGEAS